MKRICIAVATAALVSACGGGGDNPPTASSAAATTSTGQGLRTGTSSTPGISLMTLVLENNEFWSFYSVAGVGLFGFVQGTTSGTGTTLTGSGDDFGVAANQKAAATLSTTFTPQGPSTGTVTEGTSNITFNLPTYDSRYDQAAVLADLVGTWSLTSQYVVSPGPITSTVTIAADGSFTGANAYCGITGSATPRASGKNVFNLSASFTGAGCAFNGQTLNGVALLLRNGSTRQLTVGALRSDRAQAFLASGSL